MIGGIKAYVNQVISPHQHGFALEDQVYTNIFLVNTLSHKVLNSGHRLPLYVKGLQQKAG